MSYNYIINKVETIKKEVSPYSIYDICKYYDIYIHYHDLASELKGYYICCNGISNIVINQNLIEELIPLVLGHELGHHFLHNIDNLDFTLFQDSLLFGKSQTEHEANLFSAELILPDNETLLTLSSTETISEAASLSNVPVWLMNCKIQMLIQKGYNLPQFYIKEDLRNNQFAFEGG